MSLNPPTTDLLLETDVKAAAPSHRSTIGPQALLDEDEVGRPLPTGLPETATDGMAEEVDDAPVDPEALLAAEEGAKAVAYHTKYRPKKTLEAYLPRQEELK